MSLQQEGDNDCLELFLVSLITGWQSSVHAMGSSVVLPVLGSLRSSDG